MPVLPVTTPCPFTALGRALELLNMKTKVATMLLLLLMLVGPLGQKWAGAEGRGPGRTLRDSSGAPWILGFGDSLIDTGARGAAREGLQARWGQQHDGSRIQTLVGRRSCGSPCATFPTAGSPRPPSAGNLFAITGGRNPPPSLYFPGGGSA